MTRLAMPTRGSREWIRLNQAVHERLRNEISAERKRARDREYRLRKKQIGASHDRP